MTNVTISRELLERVTKTCMFTMPADDYTELRAALAAPVQGVNTQLLEALEEILYAEIHSPISMNNAGCIKKMQGIARAAIAAARQEVKP